MFGKKVVLSRDTLRVVYIVADSLKNRFKKEVEIIDCTFKTRRDHTIVGGDYKYYSTEFSGRFYFKGEPETHAVTATISFKYKNEKIAGHNVRLSVRTP